MPPKAAPPRGRGRGRGAAARGRGSSRGNSTTERNATETDTPAPPAQQVDTRAGAAAPAEPAVIPDLAALPKQNDSAQSEAVITATVEASSAEPLSAASATASQPSARPPTERLVSLKSTEPSSRSASPVVRRGASSRGRKPVLLPTNAGRRSKEERDARNAADLQRERERNKERDALAAKKQKAIEAAERREKMRAEGRGRGGHSGVSSFFGGHRPDKRVGHSAAGYSGGSGSREIRVKDENEAAGPRFKGGRDDNVWSDDEDGQVPREDIIKFIELSDDEDKDEPGQKAQLPIRIGRKEHKERTFGINTDASIDVSAGAVQQGQGPAASAADASHKGKGKAKDLEITGEKRPYKGMWQESDWPDDVKVKPEPVSSDEEDADQREQVGIGAGPVKAEQSPDRERKPKVHGKVAPNFQTDEERAEWNRIQYNLNGMRIELGPLEVEAPAVDASGDIPMADAPATAGRPNHRDGHAYLFQLPPIMPELLLPGVKKESFEHQTGLTTAAAATGQPAIKKEDDFSAAQASATKGLRFASGRVGKLRVHKSGRTTLDWGGVSYEVGPGNPSSFLQEIVSMEIIPENQRAAPEDGGEAYSYGRIKEKFVVTPNFSQLLS